MQKPRGIIDNFPENTYPIPLLSPENEIPNILLVISYSCMLINQNTKVEIERTYLIRLSLVYQFNKVLKL